MNKVKNLINQKISILHESIFIQEMTIVHKKIEEKSNEVKSEIINLLNEFKSDMESFQKESKAFTLTLQSEFELEEKRWAVERAEFIELIWLQKEKIVFMSKDVDNMIKSSTGLSDTIICLLEILEILYTL